MSSLFTPARRVFRALCLLLGLAGLIGAIGLPAQAADFLEPDQAFKLSARSPDGAQIEVRYEIVDDYYMYRERLAVVAAPEAVVLGAPQIPPGKVKFDETFQKDVETYRRELVYRVPVRAAPAEFKLTVTSQGCADAGLCYPPREQVLKVRTEGGAIRSVEVMGDEAGAAWTPAAAPAQAITAVAVAVDATSAANDGDAVSRALRSGSLWSVIAVFALAGLLLSFTPCVLPMVPILSSIIVGQGAATSRGRGLMLSISYALGMALVYTLFGVLAGLAGEGLAAMLQTPAVLGAFAALLVLLSLSMFGAYELQMPASLQTRLTAWSGSLGGGGGHHLGVFVMGGISALIVGPCVAAPLAGALLYISQTRDVLIGAVALFALACGMSVPLLLVGASAGSLLPRAGAWMDGVKRFFGITMLAVAIWMLTPVIPTWVAMAAWGLLLMVSAVLLGLLDRLPEPASMLARSAKGLALVLALVGAAQWVGLLSGGRSVLQPLGHLAGGVAAPAAAGAGSASGVTAAAPHDARLASYRRVKTSAELDQILQTAGRPVMLDFYADWCVSCKEFEQFTFPDAQVQARLAGALLLQADVTANDAADRELLKRFSLFGPPGILFFDAQGQERSNARVIGYQNVAQFLQSLERAGL